MAHIEKCKGTSAGALIRHDERRQGIKDNHIDPEKSRLNYNLCNQGDAINFMNNRINAIMNGRKPRKDAVRAISLIVTCPKNLPSAERRAFFQSVYAFAGKKFGVENLISAWVHRDEPNAQEHIHIKAVPVVIDKNTGQPKLSAKELITRAFLKQFHPELQKHVSQDLGHKVDIINGRTAGKNKEIAELKLQDIRAEIKTQQERQKIINADYEAKKAYISAFNKHFDLISGVKENKSFTGKIKSYDVPKETWETQRITRMDDIATQQAKAILDKIAKELNGFAEYLNTKQSPDIFTPIDEKSILKRRLKQLEDFCQSHGLSHEDIERIEGIYQHPYAERPKSPEMPQIDDFSHGDR